MSNALPKNSLKASAARVAGLAVFTEPTKQSARRYEAFWKRKVKNNMPTFRYAKLVRDNIPRFHEESGHTIKSKNLSGKELVRALAEKLHEEADEVDGALSREELVEEIADVQQIINDLCAVSSISIKELTHMINKKAARKGGFSKGAYIDTVTMPDENDEWVAYCRKSPEKYPEINT